MKFILKPASPSATRCSDHSVHDAGEHTPWQRLLRGGRLTRWQGKVASSAPHAAVSANSFMAKTLALSVAAALAVSPVYAGTRHAGADPAQDMETVPESTVPTNANTLSVTPLAVSVRYWDANGAEFGRGGSGNWDLGSPNWSPDDDGVSGPYSAWINTTSGGAVFGGSGGTVTLTSPITVNSLTFNAGGYDLTGGTLTLAGTDPTISVIGSTIGVDVHSTIAGTHGLTKDKAGTLRLHGTNTFSGDVLLKAGSLILADDAALGAAGNKLVTSDATRVEANGALASSRVIELGTGITEVAGTGVGSARFTGTGGLRVRQDVTLSNDSNDFTGATTFLVNGHAYFTSVGNIGEASSLGAGSTANDPIRFMAANQYSDWLHYIGDGDSSNRNWEFTPSGGTSGAVFLNNGTGTLTLTGDISTDMSVNRIMVFVAQDADLELLGGISSSTDVTMDFRGGGANRTITLGGANTYSGATLIGAAGVGATGPVTIRASVLADTGVNSSFGTGTAGGITVLNGSVISYTGSGSSSNRSWTIGGDDAPGGSILNDGSGALALGGAVDFDAVAGNNLTLGGNYGGTNTLSGVISGDGSLGSVGSGTWVLTGANTRIGAITVDGGTLRAGSASAFGTTTGVTVNGGTLDLNSFDLTTPILAGTGGKIALGSGTLLVDSATSTSYAGSIIGSGGFAKEGVGTLSLSGANTYTGDTTLGGGGLTLDFSATGAPATNIIAAASTLNMAGGTLNIVGGAGVANSQSFDGMNVTAGNNRVAATPGTGGSVSVDLGAITRTGGFIDFALPTSGSFTTDSTSLGGWATVNGSDYAKVVGGVITGFTAADYSNKDDAGNWLTGEVISDAGGTVDTPFFGTVSGSQQLGGLKYSAAADSDVSIGAGQTLGVDGTIIVASSVGSSNQTISGGSLTGSPGGYALGILQNSAGNFTIASTIVDNGGATGFTKGGTGLVALTGNNSYTGVTTLSGGTLQVGPLANGGVASSIGASTADASNLVLESGTLLFAGASVTTDRGFTLVNGGASRTIDVSWGEGSLTFQGLVTSADDAGLTKAGAGTLTLANGGNDYIGVTTVAGGTLSVNTLADGGTASGIGAASSDSGNIVLSDGGRLQYTGGTVDIDRGFTLAGGNGGINVAQAATTLTIGGLAVGEGRLVKDGAGTLVLSGANGYTGGTAVSEGILRAGSEQAFGDPTALTRVTGGGTLDLGGFDITVGGLLGDGTVALGSNTLTSSGTSANGFSGRITGTGGFTRSGSWTQTLGGCQNDYTGVTTIEGRLAVDCLADGGVASGIGASSSDAGNLVFDGGTLSYTGGSATTDRGFTLQGNGTVSVVQAATTLEFAGQVVGAGRLVKGGDGTLTLSGNNSYTGGTYVATGILRANSSNAFGTPAGVVLGGSVGALLDLNGFDAAFTFLNGGNESGGDIALGGATMTVGGPRGDADFGGAITGAGSLVMRGAGTQRLSGCDSDYTGSTTIDSGTLEVACLSDGGVASSIGASGADAGNLVLNGGWLSYTGMGSSTDRQLTLGASADSALSANGVGAVHFTNTAPVTFAVADSAQTLRLTGGNTDDNTFGAAIADNGSGVTSLTKSGDGTWILTNPGSTYTGITTIEGGVLGVDKLADGGLASSLGASSADASNLVIGNGSALRYTGTGDTTNRLFTLAAGTTLIESSGSGAIVFTDTGPVTLAGNNLDRTIALGGTNAGNNTLAGSVGDAGTGVTILAKNNIGTWVLTGNSTYTGTTVINAGKLVLGNGGTTGSIVSDTINQGTLGFDRSDTYTYAGVISSTGKVEQAGSGTTVLTATNTYTGGTTISGGTLQLGAGGTTGSIVGDVVDNGALTFNRSNTYKFGGAVSGTGSLSQIGSGTTILTADNTYAGGTTITDGTLQIGNGGTTGSIVGDVADAGALVINRSNAYTFGGAVSGTGSLSQVGSGTTILTADSTYTGGTTISAGTLQLGNGGTTGSVVGDIADNGTLAIDRSNAMVLDGLISGTGGVKQIGTGTTTFSADNSYAGKTQINAGILLVNGDQTAATGLTSVASGATLGGSGVIGGNVAIADGGMLAPGNSPGTLTINGDLALSAGSILDYQFGQADVAGGSLNDLVNVGGDLALDGTINVSMSAGGSFGGGIYRVFNYDGTLTDNGLSLGTLPSGSNVTVQTSVAGQVNLVNAAGLSLNFWDGDAGPKFDGVVDGGDGTWQASSGNDNWTDVGGAVNAGFDNGSFAVFAGTGGTVTVDNGVGAVQASRLQFASDGYTISGDALTLLGPQSTVRVGDGTAAGANMTATIASALDGSTQLVKTDLGTLVLSGTNSYDGGTDIDAGTLSISSDANLGDAAGALGIGKATLHTTADLASSRAVTLDGGATISTDTGTTFTLDGVIDGTDGLTKSGAGTLVLDGTNTYQGGTAITGGTVGIASDANLGDAAGALRISDATLQTSADLVSSRAVTLAGMGTVLTDAGTTFTLDGVVDGTGSLAKAGDGTLVLAGSNSYAGGTTIASGTLQLGNGGSTGSIKGDVVDNGTLAFERSDSYTFDGTVSGAGGLSQQGAGTVMLTADNTYAGATQVSAGILYINGDQSAATGATTASGSGTLGGTGIIGGDVAMGSGSTLAPGMLGAPGTLAINGNLSLAAGSALDYDLGQANVSGGTYNDLATVDGDLALDGTLNVRTAPGGSFDPGIYRVISYTGVLTDNGLDIGTIPSSDFFVQTSVDHQVNLINTAGLELRYWDGADTANKNNAAIDGGNGIWQNSSGNDNWTEPSGAINGPFSDASFAVFTGTKGTVTVDDGPGAVKVSGMQFATDGYLVEGDAIELAGTSSSMIRVGDGATTGADMSATIASVLTGANQLVKGGLGTLVLTGDNTYSGGTAIDAGTLQLGDGGTGGSIVGDVTTDGVLAINRSDAATLAGIISGKGGITQMGGGATTLAGTNSYTGATRVDAGTLVVNGDQSAATGLTSVADGATLGGSGVIGGNVILASGATLAPGNSPGTLTINGDLALDGGSILDYQFGQANVAGGKLNDLVNVGGDLTLDGTINVTAASGGSFGAGVYRVFNYAGTLTDNGLTLGSVPTGNVLVQTAVAGQVNLVNAAGLALNFWDGAAGPKNNSVVDGGDGIWQANAGNDNWTDSAGAVNAGYADGGYAIFAGSGGTVTVDNSVAPVKASGMQFASDGYTLSGDAITLTGPQSTLRVGDGSTAGADMTATIESVLAGTTQLVKTDAGTLVLAGSNSYTGGTRIAGGTLGISDDANLGDAAGDITFAGGTLATSADLASARSVSMAGDGTIATAEGSTFTFDGDLSGNGELTKQGEGVLLIDSDNSGYTSTSHVDGGTLAVDGVLGGAVQVAAAGRLAGNGRTGDVTNAGIVAPGRNGMGTLTVANYTGDGGTLAIDAKLGGDKSPSDLLAVEGDTAGSTTIAVTNRGGAGAQTQAGIKVVDVAGASNGSFTLQGDYTFQGKTAIVAGAYAYRLYKGGTNSPNDGDWYLRSELDAPQTPTEPAPPLYQPGVPIYESYASVLQQFNTLGTLQQRVGNRLWRDGSGRMVLPQASSSGTGSWVKVAASHASVRPRVSTSQESHDVNTRKIRMGHDGVMNETKAGRLILGINLEYGSFSSDIRSPYGYGSIKGDGAGIGTTLTWYGRNGFYVDGQAQVMHYESDLFSNTAQRELAPDASGTGFALGVEVGKRLAMGTQWSITPQAQIAWSSVQLDSFKDVFDTQVELDHSQRLVGRIGAAFNRDTQWSDGDGHDRQLHWYGIVNLYYDAGNGSRIDVARTAFTNKDERTYAGVGTGGTYSWSDNKYAIYGEAQWKASVNNPGDNNALTGTVGFRVRW